MWYPHFTDVGTGGLERFSVLTRVTQPVCSRRGHLGSLPNSKSFAFSREIITSSPGPCLCDGLPLRWKEMSDPGEISSRSHYSRYRPDRAGYSTLWREQVAKSFMA